MARILSCLLASLFTFFIGIGCASLRLLRLQAPQTECEAVQPPQQHIPNERPILAYCELANNPNKYSGQIVRVSGTVSTFIHGMVMFDPNCSSVETQTAVLYSRQHREEIRAALKGPNSDWVLSTSIIAEGEFRKVIPSNHSDAVWDTAPLQFEIIRVEKAFKPNSTNYQQKIRPLIRAYLVSF
jgi:hypothetical protein